MHLHRLTLPLLSSLTLPGLAHAELNIITDIQPVQSLVAQVVGDLSEPGVLVTGSASPHDFAFRPSQAAQMQDADVVIWVGESLSPWLEDPIATLAGDAIVLELLATPGWTPLDFREDAAFAHGHAEADDHEDEEHDEHGNHDDHATHDHGAFDPHAWTSPEVAVAWLDAIAETLAQADPDNADTYRTNAEAAQESLVQLTAEISAQLDPLRGQDFLVAHDSLQYFEAAFDFPATGAIAFTDASRPGPARIRAMQARMAEDDIACILTDPQTSTDWAELVSEGMVVRLVPADTTGAFITPGPDHYSATIRALANSLTECLSPT